MSDTLSTGSGESELAVWLWTIIIKY
jgi:hypothetical protein